MANATIFLRSLKEFGRDHVGTGHKWARLAIGVPLESAMGPASAVEPYKSEIGQMVALTKKTDKTRSDSCLYKHARRKSGRKFVAAKR